MNFNAMSFPDTHIQTFKGDYDALNYQWPEDVGKAMQVGLTELNMYIDDKFKLTKTLFLTISNAPLRKTGLGLQIKHDGKCNLNYKPKTENK